MDLYPALLFVHVLGAVGLFAALGIETVAFRHLLPVRTVDQARRWVGLLTEAARIGLVAMAAVVVAGIVMMALRWGPQPWIVTALVGVAAMIGIAILLTRRPMRRLRASLAEDAAELPAYFGPLVHGPLMSSLWLRLALAIGILGLMTVKPGVVGSITIIAASTFAGTALTLVRGRRKETVAA